MSYVDQNCLKLETTSTTDSVFLLLLQNFSGLDDVQAGRWVSMQIIQYKQGYFW